MRHRLALLALLAIAATPRGGCSPHPYDACEGKRCADACTTCAPGDPRCVETAVVKACDPAGECVAEGTFTCPSSPPPPGPCSGQACGAECTVEPPCASATPPCMMPVLLGHCDLAGACVAGTPSCTPDPCAGKACGADCSLCGSVPCLSPVRTVCDGSGACVPLGTGAACP